MNKSTPKPHTSKILKVYWTGKKGEPVSKKVTYNPEYWTEAEIVSQVVRGHDPDFFPEDIGVHDVVTR